MTVALQLTKCNSNRPITVSQQSGARGYAGLDEDVTVGTVLDQATGNMGRMVRDPGIVLNLLDPTPCMVLGRGRRALTEQASAVQAQRAVLLCGRTPLVTAYARQGSGTVGIANQLYETTLVQRPPSLVSLLDGGGLASGGLLRKHAEQRVGDYVKIAQDVRLHRDLHSINRSIRGRGERQRASFSGLSTAKGPEQGAIGPESASCEKIANQPAKWPHCSCVGEGRPTTWWRLLHALKT